MKTVSNEVRDAINNDHTNEVRISVIAEWNHNAMYKTAVDNVLAEYDEGFDTEMYPIESIAFPARPEKSGICKAVAGQTTAGYESYTDVPAARYYVSSVDDEYKYWQSPKTSVVTNTGGSYAISDCAPYVLYMEENGTTPKGVVSNKITVLFENTWSRPVDYLIQFKSTAAGAWTTVANSPTVPASGRLNFWYVGNGWLDTPVYGNETPIYAVRVLINSMSKPNSYFNLIELGARLELDVSQDVTNYTSSMNLGDVDFITPIGTIGANTGSIGLFNDEETYINNNVDSPLFDIMDKGVKFTIGYNYKVPSGTYYIQDAVMYSDTWDESESETSVSLVDYTRYFQETKPRRVLYRNMNVYEIVWRLCDILGFNSYKVVSSTASTAPPKISYFWTDNEKTLWETLQDLSRATQTAIYFNAYGQLVIRGRESTFDKTAPAVGKFTRDNVGSQLANIVTFQDQRAYDSNKVKINYSPAQFSDQKYYVIPNKKVWEPEDTVTLRASELTYGLTATAPHVYMKYQDAATWPYKGMFNIQGEFIEYDGKEYNYITGGANGTYSKGIVKSIEDQQAFDKLGDPAYIGKNDYTGKLIITERGARNTVAKDHPLKSANWRLHSVKNNGTAKAYAANVYNSKQSTATISYNGAAKDFYYLNRGDAAYPGFGYFGTRMRIDKTNHRHKVGGIMFNGSSNLHGGYYVEVTASMMLKGKARQKTNEIMVYSQKADGTRQAFGGIVTSVKSKGKDTNGDKPGGRKNITTKYNTGARTAIVMNAWNDIDVIYRPGTNDEILVYVNGNQVISAIIPGSSGWKRSPNGLWSLYSRGSSSTSYDYAYAVNEFNRTDLDYIAEPWYDQTIGGYTANQAMLGIVYDSRSVWANKKRTKKKTQRYEARFFDEFGPIMHEIREFDVEFEGEEPVVESKLYISNLDQCVPLSYSADNGSAKFILANTSRNNAVLSGDDDLTASGISTINQKLFIYGRPVEITADQFIEKKDDFAINRRGTIETEYDSKWIQSKGEAEKFATWLVENFRTSDSIVTMEVFGNPLYELGDVVNVTYNDTVADYYITEISQSFEAGLSTNLTLRKK